MSQITADLNFNFSATSRPVKWMESKINNGQKLTITNFEPNTPLPPTTIMTGYSDNNGHDDCPLNVDLGSKMLS